jgi:hypothetical protein
MWGRNPDDHRNDRCSGIGPTLCDRLQSETTFCLQDVFIIPTGAAGATAELERRKFTAEEGVCHVSLVLQEDDYDFVGSSHSIEW